MTKRQKEQVKKVMEGWQIGYAYLEPVNGGPRQEYVFDMTSENIANFIGAHQFDAKQITLTDMLDRLILNTCGGFIDQCPNQEKCSEIREKLIPIQMGENKAEDIALVSRDIYDEYTQLEEQAVMAAEIRMM